MHVGQELWIRRDNVGKRMSYFSRHERRLIVTASRRSWRFFDWIMLTRWTWSRAVYRKQLRVAINTLAPSSTGTGAEFPGREMSGKCESAGWPGGFIPWLWGIDELVMEELMAVTPPIPSPLVELFGAWAWRARAVSKSAEILSNLCRLSLTSFNSLQAFIFMKSMH